MMAQTDPAIWFDSWYNDLRDNNNDGTIDDPGEGPKGIDGLHYGLPFQAKIAPVPLLRIDQVPSSWLQTIRVSYKVCIDIPIESYRAVGVPIPHSPATRNISTFFALLKAVPGWRSWMHGSKPDSLLDGDIVAANNNVHQHAGIVDAGFIDSVINLPGPTSRRKYRIFTPSGRNDMTSVGRLLFESVLGIECYARWVGR